MDERKAKQIERVKELLRRVDIGDDEAIAGVVDEIGREAERELFVEVGKLTRDLHETLNSFRTDSRIAELMQSDIPDARERLNYVVTMTEQAAHRTLNAVEESLPLSDAISTGAKELAQSWRRFRNREMSADDFRELSRRLEEFLDETGSNMGTIHGNLSEVMMAQDFQDLTGQIIRRVIKLVDEVEGNLVDLVRLSGQKFADVGQQEKKGAPDDDRKGHGPCVPGVDKGGEVVKGQDDVDDLLSSLGF